LAPLKEPAKKGAGQWRGMDIKHLQTWVGKSEAVRVVWLPWRADLAGCMMGLSGWVW
jgi:hypothetical protein